MWDDRKYSLVIPGRPTQALRVGRPGITSEYLRSSHIFACFNTKRRIGKILIVPVGMGR